MPEGCSLDLEDDLRPRRRAATLVGRARGERLEFPAVLRQQREAETIGGHETCDPRRQRLERHGDVRRPGDDLQHLVLQLQRVDHVVRRTMRPLVLGEPVAQASQPPGDQRREQQEIDPGDDNRDERRPPERNAP